MAGASDASQEFCLFWAQHWSVCMTRGEWASWAQAVGSLLAIGIAIALPIVDSSRRRRRALLSAKAAYASIEATIEALLDALREQNPNKFQAAYRLLGRVETHLDSVPVMDLRAEQVAATVGMRGAISHVLAILGPANGSLDHVVRQPAEALLAEQLLQLGDLKGLLLTGIYKPLASARATSATTAGPR